MIAYLDTNIVTWLAQKKLGRISLKAQSLIREADLLISPIILIELEYLYEIGRTKLPSRDVQFILAAESTIRVCDFSFPAIAKTATFEKWTRDPFDRIIVANAKANGMAFLISSDEHIAKHYPRTIW